tara:strand:- start:6057 stop:6230 length:174 start_codon:yes stop_codon:yes gene_type:complete
MKQSFFLLTICFTFLPIEANHTDCRVIDIVLAIAMKKKQTEVANYIANYYTLHRDWQ